jgi:drug/metabolite transporter (DMT)-like permease
MLTGNILCLAGSFFYAIFTILINLEVKKNGGDDKFEMNCFLGIMGVYNVIQSALMMVIFHYLGWETFGLPPDI